MSPTSMSILHPLYQSLMVVEYVSLMADLLQSILRIERQLLMSDTSGMRALWQAGTNLPPRYVVVHPGISGSSVTYWSLVAPRGDT